MDFTVKSNANVLLMSRIVLLAGGLALAFLINATIIETTKKPVGFIGAATHGSGE